MVIASCRFKKYEVKYLRRSFLEQGGSWYVVRCQKLRYLKKISGCLFLQKKHKYINFIWRRFSFFILIYMRYLTAGLRSKAWRKVRCTSHSFMHMKSYSARKSFLSQALATYLLLGLIHQFAAYKEGSIQWWGSTLFPICVNLFLKPSDLRKPLKNELTQNFARHKLIFARFRSNIMSGKICG